MFVIFKISIKDFAFNTQVSERVSRGFQNNDDSPLFHSHFPFVNKKLKPKSKT